MSLPPDQTDASGHPAGSWYVDSVGGMPVRPGLSGTIRTEVCVIGGGYTGLGAALHLARQATPVVLLEAARIGAGASGRNGGQAHTGQRRDQAWLEKRLGADHAMALWRLAEEARKNLAGLIAAGMDCDFRPGLIHARHRPGGEAEDLAEIERMASRYGYCELSLIDDTALAEELGTDVYFGGVVDRGGGHLHPLKLALGMAQAAAGAGAQLYEHSRALAWRREGGRIVVEAQGGRVLCDQLIISGDGYLDGVAGADARARVIPIRNYILTTEPLGDAAKDILRSDMAAADSRFVVNYFRKTADGRLLFGGGETYGRTRPGDLARFVRRSMLKIYPHLARVRITHAWGGDLGITLPRLPYVRELAPGVRIAAGYSGQGVVLAPYLGRLLAEAVLGDAEGFDTLARLPIPPFPGGSALRGLTAELGLRWYALRDRL